MNRHLSPVAVCGMAALALSFSLVATSPASASPLHNASATRASSDGTRYMG
jgi:hypothetical protein